MRMTRIKRALSSTCLTGLAVGCLALPAHADVITLDASKDLWVGVERVSGDLQPVTVVSDGDLGNQSYSSAKISSLVGGFDTSQLLNVNNATLRVYHSEKVGADTGSLNINALTMSWDESSAVGDFDLAENDFRLLSGFSTDGQLQLAGFSYADSEGQWIELDITTIVQNWVNGTVGDADKGVMLSGGSWSAPNWFGSTETPGDFAPHIVVEGTLVPEPGSLALLGLGGLCLLGRRRNRVARD